MTYGQRWALAHALGRPLPFPGDVGDVAPEPEPVQTGTTIQGLSPEAVKTALANVSKAVWLSLGVGLAGGLIVGYFVGKSR